MEETHNYAMNLIVPLMGIAPPKGFDSWNDYYADPRPDSIKRGPMPGGAKTPSLRDYLKNIRRS